MTEQSLRVGLLQLGGRRSGIHRYSRIIGAALAGVEGVSVTEHETDLTASGLRGLLQAFAAARALRGMDVVILPYGRYRLWSRGSTRLLQLLLMHLALRRRTLTVLHDVYGPGDWRDSEWWALTISTVLSGACVVHSKRDRAVLDRLPRAYRAVLIPHFVESRGLALPQEAQRALGVEAGIRVVGMIGWIHPRKNHELAIRAMGRLDQDVHLWLVGDAPTDGTGYLHRLSELARELHVEGRVVVTGYVSEDELDLRLAAIDVGLCPYVDAAASGSLSTLLGSRRPAVVSDIPLTRELRDLAPQAVVIADASDPDALAACIRAVLARTPGPEAFDAILADRSPERTAERYMEILAIVAKQRSLGRSNYRSHCPGSRAAERRQRCRVGELMAGQDGRKRN